MQTFHLDAYSTRQVPPYTNKYSGGTCFMTYCNDIQTLMPWSDFRDDLSE